MKPFPSLSRGLPGVAMACLTLALHPLATAAEGPDTANTALTGEKAIEQLKATGQYESLSAAITAARYAVRPSSYGEPDGGARHDSLHQVFRVVWRVSLPPQERIQRQPEGAAEFLQSGWSAREFASTCIQHLGRLGRGKFRVHSLIRNDESSMQQSSLNSFGL